MKILFVISSLNTGGAEKNLTTISNYFDTLGHNITIVILSKDKPFFTSNSSIELIQLGLDRPKDGFLNRVKHIPTLIYSLKENISTLKPDIVISFMTEVNVLSTIASKLAGVPIVVSERTNYNFLSSKIWKILRRVVYPFSDALIVQSNYDKKKYSFHNNCHIIYNSIFISNQYKNIKRENIILAVGRLTYIKGFDMLIEAFSNLNYKDWKLIIVGEGELRQKLEEQISKKGLNSFIEMPGRTLDIEKYYKKASIFVLSSRMEGFPNVLIEAMAYGCSSIAFDCLTGPSDIIKNKENGVLVKPKNIKELSKELMILIDDTSKRKELGNNATKISDRLSIDKISNRWLEVIKDVLERR